MVQNSWPSSKMFKKMFKRCFAEKKCCCSIFISMQTWVQQRHWSLVLFGCDIHSPGLVSISILSSLGNVLVSGGAVSTTTLITARALRGGTHLSRACAWTWEAWRSTSCCAGCSTPPCSGSWVRPGHPPRRGGRRGRPRRTAACAHSWWPPASRCPGAGSTARCWWRLQSGTGCC